MSISRPERERECGMTLIPVAACFVVFIEMAALAVDVGVRYSAKTSAQHASAQHAGAGGALAGDWPFVLQPTATQPDTAKDAAFRTANQNNMLGKRNDIRGH